MSKRKTAKDGSAVWFEILSQQIVDRQRSTRLNVLELTECETRHAVKMACLREHGELAVYLTKKHAAWACAG